MLFRCIFIDAFQTSHYNFFILFKEALQMARLTIHQEICKGCGLCADVCPRHLLSLSKEINAKGYHPIDITDQEKCIGCAFCARMCPDAVIAVEK